MAYIRKVEDDKYLVTVSYKDDEGNKRRKVKTVNGNYEDAKETANEIAKSLGIYREDSNSQINIDEKLKKYCEGCPLNTGHHIHCVSAKCKAYEFYKYLKKK